MESPALVERAVDAYLASVDAVVPGLIEGMYLEGSVALGDFRPHTSDIDFVAVTSARPEPTTFAALERVHDRLRRDRRSPAFDGIYLTWADLAHGPEHAGSVPYVGEGRLRAGRNRAHSPVTWHIVARYGVALRGPASADLDVWADRTALAQWTDDNLDRYWGRWLNRARRLPSKLGVFALTSYAATWVVTGVSRLHYTLATGDITSKEGAGRYALETFGQDWHRVVNESLRIRRAEDGRSLYRTRTARRRDILAFGDMVIADAHRVYAEKSA